MASGYVSVEPGPYREGFQDAIRFCAEFIERAIADKAINSHNGPTVRCLNKLSRELSLEALREAHDRR